MKIIKRKNKVDELRVFVDNEMQEGVKKYEIAVDKRNGLLVFLKRKTPTEYYIPIGRVDLNVNHTPKNVSEKASQIYQIVKKYEKESECLISYARAKSEYGKKNVTDKAFVALVDNPFYKCAAPMRLYDKNVIEYYMAKQDGRQ